MLMEFLPLLIILLLAVFIGVFVVVLGSTFGPKRPGQRKNSPYESGMVPYGPAKRRISVRYYLIAVLFILFDIEVVFLVPWAVVVRQIGVPGLVFMIIFVLILEVAHLYAWKKGALEWD
ncbi:MAG: NADH-quinone oxidoreductase subunit A [Chloroflexi bacterium HGW-Chloroflexi-2]|jgi:NADH-quinone oxidoreductase subunit A|nr:MAG: NADH-quinone oxidoreductase subunit A [Chloroflexi bacterium HGW-Chloroflexi-2]